MNEIIRYVTDCLVVILIGPWAQRQALQELVRIRLDWYMTQKEDIIQRLTEWQEVANAIDRGEKPFPLSDELTQKLGKVAHNIVVRLQKELQRLDEQWEASSSK